MSEIKKREEIELEISRIMDLYPVLSELEISEFEKGYINALNWVLGNLSRSR